MAYQNVPKVNFYNFKQKFEIYIYIKENIFWLQLVIPLKTGFHKQVDQFDYLNYVNSMASQL